MLKRTSITLLALIAVLGVVLGASVFAAAQGEQKAAAEPAKGKAISFPYTGEKVTYTYGYNEGWCPEYFRPGADNLIMNGLAKRLGNVELKYVPVNWDDKTKAMLATNTLPDITILDDSRTKAKDYGPNGLFLELSQYESLFPSLTKIAKKFPFARIEQGPDGKYFGENLALTTEEYFWNSTTFDGYWLKKGLAIPETVDDAYAFLKKVKELNANANPLQLTYNWYITYISSWFGANTGRYWDSSQKKYIFGPYQENLRKAIDFAAKLYREELMPKDFVTMSNEEAASIIYNPKGNLWAMGVVGWGDLDTKAAEIKKTEPDFDFVIGLLPASEKGGVHRVVPYESAGSPPWFGVFVRADVKNPQLLVSLLNYLASDEINQLTTWGVEGVTYTVKDGKKTLVSGVKTVANPSGVDGGKAFGIGNHSAVKPYSVLTGYFTGQMEVYYAGPTATKGMKLYKDYYYATPAIQLDGTADPSLSAAENEKISAIMTPVKTFVDEELVKFVMGRRSMDEWDTFVKDIKSRGDPQVVLDIYASKQRMKLMSK